MKITCIDFETANPFWGSICAAGIAVIDGRETAETMVSFIKPHPKYGEFNRDNIRVHGIKPEMVENAPEFPAFYPQIRTLVEGGLIAAHNSSFDVDCLRDVLTIYNIPIPSFEHICTCEIAQKAWGAQLDGFTLKKVNTFLGYKFKHHDAGEDAKAAANIILKAMEKTGIYDIREMTEALGVKIRKADPAEPYELSAIRREKRIAKRVDARSVKPESAEFDETSPLYKKEIVFTGDFANGMSRREVMQKAVNRGAKLCNYVRSATDFLVQGSGDGVMETTKTRRAKKMVESGLNIRIISEKEYLEILED